eukprot:g8994.t1
MQQEQHDHRKLWSGVLGVVFESDCAQENWDLATELVRAGAEYEDLDLHAAVKENQLELETALLERGASAHTAGETPLHFALGWGEQQERKGQDGVELIDLLLRRGADETIVNGDGATALGRLRRSVCGRLRPSVCGRLRPSVCAGD